MGYISALFSSFFAVFDHWYGLVVIVVSAPVSAFVLLELANALVEIRSFKKSWLVLTCVLLVMQTLAFVGLRLLEP